MLEVYVEDNNYVRFDPLSYHCCREIHFNGWIDENMNSYQGFSYLSEVGAC